MITSAIDKNCTFLISNEKSTSVQQEEICKDLESTDVNNKIRYFNLYFAINWYLFILSDFNFHRAIKNAIMALLSGESMPRVLMTVIRLSSIILSN